MEKHKCKLCLRNFANGRALGGHMRSHMMNMYVPAPPKPKQEYQEDEQEKNDYQLISEEMGSLPSSSSSSSSSSEEEEMEEEEIGNRGLMSKGFREKKRRMMKRSCLVDPQSSFVVDATIGSVVLQDRESETESSRKSICRRSKRIRKSIISGTRGFSVYNMTEEPLIVDKSKCEKEGKSPREESPLLEHEPVSSISDTTPDEDVAYCLMMLSRDKWNEEEEEEEEEESEEEKVEIKKDAKDDSGDIKVNKSGKNRGKYRCETCNKVFRSYQALGGHRASHKRVKLNINRSVEYSAMVETTGNAAGTASCSVVVEEKIHECPVCYRVFSSGQALGGHKRSHVIGTAAAAANISIIPSKTPFSRFGETLIDLNLPAPMDDDDDDYDEISQIELSAVSDAEFVKPHQKINSSR